MHRVMIKMAISASTFVGVSLHKDGMQQTGLKTCCILTTDITCNILRTVKLLADTAVHFQQYYNTISFIFPARASLSFKLQTNLR